MQFDFLELRKENPWQRTSAREEGSLVFVIVFIGIDHYGINVRRLQEYTMQQENGRISLITVSQV